MNEHNGLFISFEGTEGSGKTTQMRLLSERLRREGWPVVENQEPGATRIGTKIRQILLDPANAEMASETEMLLMFASRAQAAAEIIRPALRAGKIVVSDRFTDSSLAYQGEGRGLGFERILKAHELALGSLLPDITICIAVDLGTGLERAHRRNRDNDAAQKEERIDRLSLQFHESVLKGYRKIAAREPHRFRVIQGDGDPETVACRVWEEVSVRLPIRVKE